MKFHCKRCGRDFTTFGMSDAQKYPYTHLILSRMFCIYCGSSNSSSGTANVRKRRHNERWDPKAPFSNDETAQEQFVVLHKDCAARTAGSSSSVDGIKVYCDGCPKAFVCLTGNVDDGSVKTVEQTYAERVAEAKKFLANRPDDPIAIMKRRDKMRNLGLSLRKQGDSWILQFKGTIWKLAESDCKIIANGNLTNYSAIRRTFENNSLDINSLIYLVSKRNVV